MDVPDSNGIHLNQELAERYCSGTLDKDSLEYKALLQEYFEKGDDSELGKFAMRVQSRAKENAKVQFEYRDLAKALLQGPDIVDDCESDGNGRAEF